MARRCIEGTYDFLNVLVGFAVLVPFLIVIPIICVVGAILDLSRPSPVKTGLMISNPEAIGQRVFVSDADRGTTIKTTISGELIE